MTAIEEEELVNQIWSVVKHDSLASSRIGYPAGSTRDAIAQIFKDREAALTQQHEREKKELFESAQQAFQRSLAAMKEYYEQQQSKRSEPKRVPYPFDLYVPGYGVIAQYSQTGSEPRRYMLIRNNDPEDTVWLNDQEIEKALLGEAERTEP